MKPIAAAVLSAALLAAPPVSAAVVQTGPVSASFAGDLPFSPSRQGLAFDAGLGTLNTVTLSFVGTVEARISGLLFGPPPYPETATASVSAVYQAGPGQEVARVAIDPVTGPFTVTEPPAGAAYGSGTGGASLSAPRGFELTIPGPAYGPGQSAADNAIYAVFSFDRLPLGSTTFIDAGFRGTVSALFDYTPAGGGAGGGQPLPVPEPASLALLGIGLAGLMAARRR